LHYFHRCFLNQIGNYWLIERQPASS
jgi:hypothetical protein